DAGGGVPLQLVAVTYGTGIGIDFLALCVGALWGAISSGGRSGAARRPDRELRTGIATHSNLKAILAGACQPSRVGLAHCLLWTLTGETGGAYATPCRRGGTGTCRGSAPAVIRGRSLASAAVERKQSAAGRPAAAVPRAVIARARTGAEPWPATRAQSRANAIQPGYDA